MALIYPVFGSSGDLVADGAQKKERPAPRFHGRVEGSDRPCAMPGCTQAGEFRAPARDARPSEGPPPFRWMCLDHVRAFNARYNFFDGMSPEEIQAAQRPFGGWERETRAFSGSADRGPRWADFPDPLDAIGARFRRDDVARDDGRALSTRDRENLKILGLSIDCDRTALRKRYGELVRRYHPDRNGGDRSHEGALRKVIDAYQQLKGAPAFA
jgi:hypothetical protein